MYLSGIAIREQETMFLAVNVLFWIAIIGGVGAVLRNRAQSPSPEGLSPEEDLLFKRFAHGEIDDDEYRHRREALRREPHPCGHDSS